MTNYEQYKNIIQIVISKIANKQSSIGKDIMVLIKTVLEDETYKDIIFDIFMIAMDKNNLNMINFLCDYIREARDDEYLVEYAIRNCNNLNLCKLIIKKLYIDMNIELEEILVFDRFTKDNEFKNNLFKYLLQIGHVANLDDTLWFCWDDMHHIIKNLII